MSCEHFFCTWGCQKQARANSQDHLNRESMPNDALRQAWGRMNMNWL